MSDAELSRPSVDPVSDILKWVLAGNRDPLFRTSRMGNGEDIREGPAAPAGVHRPRRAM